MKFLLVSILVLNLGFTVFALDIDAAWKDFKDKFHSKSTRSKSELAERKKIFTENVKEIEEHNSNPDNTFTMGINKFSDWSEAEKQAMLLPDDLPEPEIETVLRPVKKGEKVNLEVRSGTVPDSWDWRAKGKVSPIRDQNPCSSCWAFGATAAIESLYLIKYNKTLDLSEQNLMDCVDKRYERPRATCDYGGWPQWAYKFIYESKGYAEESQYPYIRQTQQCKASSNFKSGLIDGWVTVPPGNEEEMKKALYSFGPLTVNIDAAGFYALNNGIYDTTACSNFGNHIVTIVGYGTEKGRDYWIIKNSWTTGWGEKGFGKVARGKNMCGIANHVTYPVKY